MVNAFNASGIDKDPARIAGMFDAIAARYDFLNHLLSAGLDRRWRRRALRSLELTGPETLLDLCTGTADVAIAGAVASRSPARIVGVDFAPAMLTLGLGKVRRAGLERRITLVRGDAVRVPLLSASVDAVTVAFGIRNVVDPAAACREMRRVLRPGGRIAILEFAEPRARGLRAAYLWYFRHALPCIGRLVSRHQDAYAYLPASVGTFPSPDQFAGVLRELGFSDVSAVPLSFGIVYLYTARA